MQNSDPVSLEAAHQIDRFFETKVKQFTDGLDQLDREIPRDAIAVEGDAYHQRAIELLVQSQDDCREFEASLDGDRTAIQAAQKRFLIATDPWLRKSWFADRARTKPSGFSGDFNMLVKIYEWETPVTGLGSYLDKVFMKIPLACAVRGRMKSVRSFLLSEMEHRTGEVKVLDVASGPCREYLQWPSFEGKSMHVTTMDNDQFALDYVQATVAPMLPASTRIDSVRYNAMRTRSAESTIEKFGKFDIIYSVGLCDYLTDEHLISLLGAWHNTLADGGVMFVAFKDTRRYDHTPYQWHLDWFFYQRTHEDVLKLYEKAGFDVAKMSFERDESGVIINYVARQDLPTKVRVDVAHSLMKRARKVTRQADQLIDQ
jgi:extracellular factor (EF) 3-hydroxypalmitic acid methyl ester biosynthesis protein